MRKAVRRGTITTICCVGVALMLLTSIGCGDSGDGGGGDKKYTIGFVSPGLDATYWNNAYKGAVAEGKKLKDARVVTGAGPGRGQFTAMIPLIQNMLTRGVDALVVPGLPELMPALKRVHAADVPIIFYGNDVPGSTIHESTVITEYRKGGNLLGNYVKDQLKGKGTVAIIRYPKGQYPPIDARVDGFEEALEGTGIKVAAYLDVGCDAEAPAVAAVQNLLTRMPDISAIFGQCGTPALGAEKAIQHAGIAPGKILVVGYDGEPAEIDAILDGTQGATVAQYPFKLGGLAVQTADKVLNGQTVPKTIDPGSLLITKENAADIKDKRL